MLILGIDPGTARTGFGIISEEKGKLSLISYGCIETPGNMPVEMRLKRIYNRVRELLEKWPVEAMAVEKVFFNKNVKTAIDVNQARGVILLASAEKSIKIKEYTPREVKQAIIGSGEATKKQVQYMVKTILSLKEEPKPDDAADALALAICHLNYQEFYRAVRKA